ncbi:hypothetical protein FBY31_3833 [Arthrobacter sp. SLBN-100]|uniref:hypothetical protein n=1 Tax=Arthrobacter sp. SLBN-100 TaxID=2768450 RepID=UPI001151AABD|nr:hypothetical protein [Arthrobacter sp. SLBN-100]TQJ69671.1 hypothetical protein FBY31_3833 [Arthrobacter sp. SLBN-100]
MNQDSPFEGLWSYRSFRNDPDLSTEFNALRFGAGTLNLMTPEVGHVAGSLGGEGWRLDLTGGYDYGNPFALRFQGLGEIGGELWVYDYVGYLVPLWPHGVDQIPAITGSVIRTAPHSKGQATAGYVASFIAVRQS